MWFWTTSPSFLNDIGQFCGRYRSVSGRDCSVLYLDLFCESLWYFWLSWHMTNWSRWINHQRHSKSWSRTMVEYRSVSSIFVQIVLNDVVQISFMTLLGAPPDQKTKFYERISFFRWVDAGGLFSPLPFEFVVLFFQETKPKNSSEIRIFWEDKVVLREKRRSHW